MAWKSEASWRACVWEAATRESISLGSAHSVDVKKVMILIKSTNGAAITDGLRAPYSSSLRHKIGLLEG